MQLLARPDAVKELLAANDAESIFGVLAGDESAWPGLGQVAGHSPPAVVLGRMDVTVAAFLGSGLAYRHDLDVHPQGLAGKRMVRVDDSPRAAIDGYYAQTPQPSVLRGHEQPENLARWLVT